MNRKRANKISHSKDKTNRLDVAFYLKAELGIVISRQCLLQRILKQSSASCFTLVLNIYTKVLNILFASYVSGSLFNLLFNQYIPPELKNKWDLK